MLTLLHHYPGLTAADIQRNLNAKGEEDRDRKIDRNGANAPLREDDDNSTTGDPFERPLTLITRSVVKPLERRVSSSLDRFLEERVMRTDGQPLRSVFERVTVATRGLRDAAGSIFFEDKTRTRDRTKNKKAAAAKTASGAVAPPGTDEAAAPEETRIRMKADGEFIYLRRLFRQ